MPELETGKSQYRWAPAPCMECGHMGQSRRCRNCNEGPFCERCLTGHIQMQCDGSDDGNDLEPGPKEGVAAT